MRAGYYGGPGYGASAARGANFAPKPPVVPVAPAAAPPAPPVPEAEVGHAAQICVSGCSHSNVAPIVRGDYTIAGSNHNKPAYKKEQKVSGLDVMLYYWDDRDGVAFSGWWFGPKIGGDQVWAYQPSRTTQTPPSSGWKVPYDGPVDLSLCVTAKAGSSTAMAPAVGASPVRSLDAQARSQQIAEMKKQAEEKKRRLEEARIKAEENRKRLEEANKKRIEDEKRRLEESKKKAEEQKAAFAIRQAFQKMKLANLDNFDQIHEEVAKVMDQELEKCGSLQSTIQAEHDKGWEQVKLRMEQLQVAKQKLQEQKKAAKEKAEAYVKDLDDAVAAAEAASSVLKESVDSLTEAMEKLKPDQVNDMIFSIDTATREAQEAYQTCTQLMRKVPDGMKVSDPDVKELKEQNSRLMQRMAACSMTKDTAIKSSASIKTEAMKKAKAKVKLNKDTALFSKYDSNKDGVLDKKEIAALAKKEYSFTMPESALTNIFKALVDDGSKGVKKIHLQRLKMQIGVARERAKDLQRRKRREAHEKEIESIKDSLRTKVEDLFSRLKEAEESVAKVEEDGRPLHAKGKDMKACNMESFADEIDLQVKDVKDLVEELRNDLTKVKQEANSEVTAWFLTEMRPVETRHAKLEPRLQMVSNASTRFRETMKSKERAELLAVEQTATNMLRYHQKVSNLRSDDVVDALCDENSGEAASEASFVKFFETVAKDPEANGEAALQDDELKRLFNHWDEEGEGTVSRETLLSHIRKLMKVVKTAALTDGKSIKDSKSIRRLSEGEVVEVLSVEEKDDDADLMRLKVKAMNDNAEGWVSISGNQGTLFLKDGGHLFKVVKETILTDCFALDGQSAKEATRRLRDEPRKLKTNELVQVRSWMKKEEKSGLMRMKCRAISDGAVGWATVVGNAGTVYLQVT